MVVKKKCDKDFDHVGLFSEVDSVLSFFIDEYEDVLEYLMKYNPELYFNYIGDSRIDGTNMYKVDIKHFIRDLKISEILK